MTKIYLTFLIAFAGFFQLNAQQLLVTPSDSVAVTGSPADGFDAVDAHIYLVNNGKGSITVTWQLQAYTAPTAWELFLCDNANCYDLLQGSPVHESLTVLEGDTLDMKFQYVSHCVTGTGMADVVAYVTGDSVGTAVTLNYKAELTPTCVNSISTIQNNQIKLFPNPVNDIVNLRDLSDVSTVRISDVTGRVYQSLQVVSQDMSISVKELPAGAYILTAFDKAGAVIGNQRFTKS